MHTVWPCRVSTGDHHEHCRTTHTHTAMLPHKAAAPPAGNRRLPNHEGRCKPAGPVPRNNRPPTRTSPCAFLNRPSRCPLLMSHTHTVPPSSALTTTWKVLLYRQPRTCAAPATPAGFTVQRCVGSWQPCAWRGRGGVHGQREAGRSSSSKQPWAASAAVLRGWTGSCRGVARSPTRPLSKDLTTHAAPRPALLHHSPSAPPCAWRSPPLNHAMEVMPRWTMPMACGSWLMACHAMPALRHATPCQRCSFHATAPPTHRVPVPSAVLRHHLMRPRVRLVHGRDNAPEVVVA